MSVSLDATIAALVEAAVGRAFDARMDPIADRVVAKLRTADAPAAEPLKSILGGSAARVRMMEARHPDLRALAVGLVGRRRLYRRRDVEAWIASHAAEPSRRGRRPGPSRLRTVDGSHDA